MCSAWDHLTESLSGRTVCRVSYAPGKRAAIADIARCSLARHILHCSDGIQHIRVDRPSVFNRASPGYHRVELQIQTRTLGGGYRQRRSMLRFRAVR